jgi:tetratricopeptide (TPR) repeat protein
VNKKFVLSIILLGGLLTVIGLSASRMAALYYATRGGSLLSQAVGSGKYTPIFCSSPPANKENIRMVKQAVADFQTARKWIPSNPRLSLLLGRSYCLLGEMDNATAAYETYLQLRPRDDLARIEQSFAYEGASSHLATEAWKSLGLDMEKMLRLQRQALQNQDYPAALGWYRRAARLAPGSPDIFPEGFPIRVVVDGFLAPAHLTWGACRWCSNSRGDYRSQNGVLVITASPPPRNAVQFAVNSNLALPTASGKDVAIRLRGDPGTLLVEVELDKMRSRPLKNSDIPGTWNIVTFPIQGQVLDSMVIKYVPSSDSGGKLEVDWIVIQ